MVENPTTTNTTTTDATPSTILDSTNNNATTTTADVPVHTIPSSVTSLAECAAWQIQALLEGPNETDNAVMEDDWEDALDDGFVLCDLQTIVNKVTAWRNHLFPSIAPYYAVKCHPDPKVVQVLAQQGVCFDCASGSELNLVLTNSTTVKDVAQTIVYANPQRAEQDLERALQQGISLWTFDGPEELYKIQAAHQKLVQQQQVEAPLALPLLILRILVPDHGSTVPLGEKFGTDPARVAELAHLAIDTFQFDIVGISFHCGSGNHDAQAFCTAIALAQIAMEQVNEIYKKLGKSDQACWLLDIGGGYPGRDGVGADELRFRGQRPSDQDQLEPEKDVEVTSDIAKVVRPVLDKLYQDYHHPQNRPLQVIAEPGRYFVEAAFALCSRIFRRTVERDSDGTIVYCHYYIAQGVQGLFKDCILCNESFLPIPYAINNNDSQTDDAQTIPCSVHGPSGEDYDVICQNYALPPLQVGDWLVFDRMGAYTLSIAARSGRPPIRYVAGGAKLE